LIWINGCRSLRVEIGGMDKPAAPDEPPKPTGFDEERRLVEEYDLK
jgi:hypothetical protein